MKKIALLSLSLLTLLGVGCDEKLPMDESLYPETVYLVGAINPIINKDLNIGYEQDTVYVSVAISGTQSLDRDVTVGLEEFPSAIKRYNDRQLGANDVLYQNLAKNIYSFPQEYATVQKGSTYGTYPVYVKPGTLHIDSLYMISLKLNSTSDYELTKKDTVLLVKFNMMNKYSGLYYMDAVIKNTENESDSVSYKTARTLQSVKDGNTVRMYHEKNEWVKGGADYRPGYCFNITVKPDNTLSLSPWDKFQIIDGGGSYDKEFKAYKIWYTFKENGVVKKVRGFLYKERKNDEEQRLINNWMEENEGWRYAK